MPLENLKLTAGRGGSVRRLSLLLLLIACLVLVPAAADAITDITNTKHNLSSSGPGPIKSDTENRICVFCHTPHNATPSTPLWNRELKAWSYIFYTSPSLKSPVPTQPTGATKLCLSCHDGMTAIGAVLNPSGGITMRGGVTTMPSGLTLLGTNLSSHHPVSFSYKSALPNDTLVSTPPYGLTFGGTDDLQCTTCHDPHDNTYGEFLVMDHRYSALCIKCHQMPGWSTSAHATSPDKVNGVLPIAPKTWPTWLTVAEWGCEICHTPHFAATPQLLLNYTSETFCETVNCHSGTTSPSFPFHEASSAVARTARGPIGGMADIRAQMRKNSAHHIQPGVASMGPRNVRGASRSVSTSVTCSDCHNPHSVNKTTASAPLASGMVQGVSGVDRNGIEISSVTYEYEICFKCHSDYSPDFPYIPRAISTANKRLQFDPINPSYHPVVSMGKNLSIPSIPSPVQPGLASTSIIYCTDCHRDDSGGSKGPHGSAFAPILRERYMTTDGTQESYENYALCYRCHNQSSILNDASFKKKKIRTTATGGGHSGHLAKGAPCSACHDPHGVNITSLPQAGTGSHTHLINFDTRIVMPAQGNRYPFFTDNGTFSGSCTLICHGRVHINESYP